MSRHIFGNRLTDNGTLQIIFSYTSTHAGGSVGLDSMVLVTLSWRLSRISSVNLIFLTSASSPSFAISSSLHGDTSWKEFYNVSIYSPKRLREFHTLPPNKQCFSGCHTWNPSRRPSPVPCTPPCSRSCGCIHGCRKSTRSAAALRSPQCRSWTPSEPVPTPQPLDRPRKMMTLMLPLHYKVGRIIQWFCCWFRIFTRNRMKYFSDIVA